MALDAEADHRLAGLGDAVDDALGPAVLDADDHDGGDVRVRAGADQRAEMDFQILAELQAAIGVRDGERALDVVGDGLAGGVGEIVERQQQHMVAHADAAVLAAPAHEGIEAAAGRALDERRLEFGGFDLAALHPGELAFDEVEVGDDGRHWRFLDGWGST